MEKVVARRNCDMQIIALGTNAGHYQLFEKKILRNCVNSLSFINHDLVIVTRVSLIQRYIDVLSYVARDGLTQVEKSVSTLKHSWSQISTTCSSAHLEPFYDYKVKQSRYSFVPHGLAIIKFRPYRQLAKTWTQKVRFEPCCNCP